MFFFPPRDRPPLSRPKFHSFSEKARREFFKKVEKIARNSGTSSKLMQEGVAGSGCCAQERPIGSSGNPHLFLSRFCSASALIMISLSLSLSLSLRVNLLICMYTSLLHSTHQVYKHLSQMHQRIGVGSRLPQNRGAFVVVAERCQATSRVETLESLGKTEAAPAAAQLLTNMVITADLVKM